MSLLQRNINDELFDGQSSLHCGGKPSGSRNETMSLVALLQDMPLGINPVNPPSSPPRKPNRQLTIQDLNEVLDMLSDDEDDDLTYGGDVRTLSFSNNGTLQGLYHPSAPICPNRQDSFQSGSCFDEQDHADHDDNDEFDLEIQGLDETETCDDEEVVPPRLTRCSSLPPRLPLRIEDEVDDDDNFCLSVLENHLFEQTKSCAASSPPKLPRRSVDSDEMNAAGAAVNDGEDKEDGNAESSPTIANGIPTAVKRNSTLHPPRLPSRRNSGKDARLLK